MMAKIMLSSMRMRASLTLSRSRLREGEPTGLPLSTAAHLPLATPASLGLARLACHRRHDAAGCEVADPSPPILAHDLAAPFLQAALMVVLCCAPLRSLGRPASGWKTLSDDPGSDFSMEKISRENRCRKSVFWRVLLRQDSARERASGRESNLHQKTRREA